MIYHKYLTYHKINNKQSFEAQIKYLAQNYYNSCRCDQSKAFRITADDGDPSFYYNAFPILKKYKIPAIIFVITDLIDTQNPFWWDEIEYYLGNKKGNKKVWEVKSWPNKERVNYLISLRQDSKKPKLKYPQLTTKQLLEMQNGGIVIANHSHTHPMFDRCTHEELDFELNQSTQILKNLGLTPDIFAYPNGNYSELAEETLKDYGIKQAFLFDHKINKRRVNPLRISRLAVNDNTPMWKFKLILSGWHTQLLPLIKSIAKFKQKLF